MQISEFRDLALKYDAIFFDAFGVLKNHKGLIEGVVETLNFLNDNKIPYYILTNDASRSPQQLALSYSQLNVPVNSNVIISSGMLAAEYLNYKVNSGNVAFLGTDNCAHYIESIGLNPIAIRDLEVEDYSDIKALVFMDDEGFDWSTNINKTINLIQQENIPVIVANTDQIYPVSKTDVALAIGGIADMIETITKKNFIRFGKPDSQIFNFAFEHIQQFKAVDKSKVLMVGDTLTTDIIGGNKFGMDTVLVLSGNTSASKAEGRINSSGIQPTYICNSIA